MTQNQINYARVREEQRHNLATEGMSKMELAETSRHNVVSENVSWYSAQEAGRHNVASENLNWYLAPSQAQLNEARAESALHDITLNDLKYDLDLSKFEEQKWKDLWSTWNDSKRVAMAQKETDAQIDKWIRDFGLESAKWYDTMQSKEYSQTIKNQVAAGKDMIEIMSTLAKLAILAFG